MVGSLLPSAIFTSSLDARTLAKVLLDLASGTCPTGILNIASSEVSSKDEFILAVAEKFGLSTVKMKAGSLIEMTGVRRAESLGLDVRKAEELLGYPLPGLKAVVKNLYDQYKKGHEI